MNDQTASETPEKSLRDELHEAMTATQSQDRDDKGKFVAEADDTAQVDTQEVSEPEIEAPNSWKAEAKQHWTTLPKEVKQYIVDREAEVHKGFTRQDEERTFGKQFRDVLTPYMAMIQAEGASPAQAVQSLLNTAYTLRTANPAQKAELFRSLAQQYQVPLDDLTQQQQYVDPALEQLQSRLAQIERENQMLQQQRVMQNQYEMESTIAAFGSKPGHEHLGDVSAHMSALIQSGVVQGATPDELLENAYQQAIWAKPELRSTLLAQQQAEEAKRAAEAKQQKADAARRAAGSVSGSPGTSAPATQTPSRSLREELTANFRSATQ